MAERFNWKGAVAFAVTTALAVEAVSHPFATKQAVKALIAPDPNCAEIMSNLSKYDAIAVFGAGTFQDENGRIIPNTYQRSRLKAAAEALVAGYADKVILVDGGEGETLKSSTYLLNFYIENMTGHKAVLDANKVSHISDSPNSAANIRDLRANMKEYGLKNVIGITDQFHYNRLALLAENYGVNVDIAPTECIATYHMPKDLPTLDKRKDSDEMRQMVWKEKLGTLELAIDTLGELTIKLKE